tara:strand:+ start:3889 stop:4560 length:672 start_codon:yes stop_codon:yes gene_type:complete
MSIRLGQKTKKFVRLGLKTAVGVGAVGAAALGVKTTKDEYAKQKDAEFSRARNQLAGDLQSLKTEAGLKKLTGEGTETGTDSQGNIFGTGGITAGRGVVANPNIVKGAQGQLPVGKLSQQQLAPFNAKREGARAVAGVVGGQIGAREAVRDVAGAAFEGMGGRRGQDPLEDFRQTTERGSRGGTTLVAGATGDERFTARESAGILGRRAGRAIGKLNPLKFVR